MNANPADCDCERCEIDRARALPTGVAHGLPRSDHSAGERSAGMPWKAAAIAIRRQPLEPCWR